MVVATGRAHEDGLATEFAGHDLEAEDSPVELGRSGRVANVQDGVVEAGDGDAHMVSLPGRWLRVEPRRRRDFPAPAAVVTAL